MCLNVPKFCLRVGDLWRGRPNKKSLIVDYGYQYYTGIVPNVGKLCETIICSTTILKVLNIKSCPDYFIRMILPDICSILL